jgi:hypothetical protein
VRREGSCFPGCSGLTNLVGCELLSLMLMLSSSLICLLCSLCSLCKLYVVIVVEGSDVIAVEPFAFGLDI